MEYMVGGVVFGLCLFILPLWAYRRGLKDGLSLNQGKPIEPIKSPVAVVQKHMDDRTQAKEAKAADDAMAQGMANLMAYDGSPQPQPKEGEK